MDLEGKVVAGESGGSTNDDFERNSSFKIDEDSCSIASSTFEANSSSNVESLLLQALMDQREAEVLSTVSREEFSRNEQEQEDEIVVLESIYGGSFKRLSVEQRCFMIEVSLEVIEDVTVFMPPVQGRNRDSFRLQYLPPIHLACLLPSTYPSRTRPTFVLHAQWLSTQKLSQLSEELIDIWEGQKGDVVVYPWTELLHSQGLSAIGASKEMELDSPQHHNNDLRVISGCTSIQDTALSLLQYNEDMHNHVFRWSFHLCSICFEEHIGLKCIRFPCLHVYCRDCMQQYVSVHVRDGSINNLKCPNTECRSSIPPSALKQLLSKDEFERWEQLCLQRTLDTMDDVFYCPRCNTACIEDGDHHAQCSRCLYSFCSLCRNARHLGQPCVSLEARLEILRQQQQRQLQDEAEQRRREENITNELKNLALVKEDCKCCPVCKMAIFKISGCNRMICTNCNSWFCFRCRWKIDSYDHFRKKCALFDTEDEERAQQRRRQQVIDEEKEATRLARLARSEQLNQQAQQRQEAARGGKICPSCRQPNAKNGNNNHICCFSCQSRYCGQCLEIVRKPSEHFGRNKCKQHSVDPS